MNASSLNYWPILIAGVASFVFGGLWYGTLGRHWLAARNLSPKDAEQARANTGIVPYVIASVALLIMAWMLSGVMVHLARGGMPLNIRTGLISGFLVWFGFVMTTLTVNHSFQGAKGSLTLIDGGHWLGVLLIQGAILGWWGVA